MLANCGFAAIFAAPKLAGLQHLGHSAAEEQQLTQKWALALLKGLCHQFRIILK